MTPIRFAGGYGDMGKRPTTNIQRPTSKDFARGNHWMLSAGRGSLDAFSSRVFAQARLLPLLLTLTLLPAHAQGTKADYERAQSLARRTEQKIFRTNLKPNWLPGTNQFWYRIQTDADKFEFALVDADTGNIKRAADAKSLGLPPQESVSTSQQRRTVVRPSLRTGESTAISFNNQLADAVELFWIDAEGKRQSYGRVRPGDTRAQHTYAGHVWLVTDAVGNMLGVFEAAAEKLDVVVDGKPERTAAPEGPRRRERPGESPDGKWTIQFTNHNVVLVEKESGGATHLTQDGTEEKPYRGPVAWSSDSQNSVVQSVRTVKQRVVTLVESSPREQLQPKVQTYDYFKPGDDLPQPQPVLIRPADKSVMVITNALFLNFFTESGRLELRWSQRGDEFYFNYNQRGHQLYRIIGVNATNGAARAVVEESSQTFVDYSNKTWRHWLAPTGELLWMSERDGWCHLWLYDVATGAVKNQVTRGAWVVRSVVKVDEAARQVWFMASGLRAGEDPYHLHLCRVNLDGSGLVQLTQSDGNHSVQFAPDGKYFIAKWSRADHPPVHELRHSEDGKLICELERAEASALLKADWTMPERFVAKGRDGRTDIHGIIIKPSNFDPQQKYPVVEEVYAGPHGSFAPKEFGRLLRQHALAELGFIVVQADGMGTNHRGKKFQDLAWKNLQDAGFPDRIAWIRAAAQTRVWMDLKRVGIYGGSAGGQSAMRALLDYNEFYSVAVADCGCHDNRMDKIWWNEQWLGWPLDESYVKSSNVEDAAKLQGKLLLFVGELDRNVDPASTMQVVNALIRADKDFDLAVMTGAGHGAAETPYGIRRRMDFFVRHLHGLEPRKR
jgi:dipeptidyl-peptidase-4